VFCLPCHNVNVLGINILSRKDENAFVSSRFSNWKDATADFKRHEASQQHSECVMKWHHHLKGDSVETMLSSEKEKQQQQNRSALHKIVSSLQFLGRQGLPLRGHDDLDGNLMQLLELRKAESVELTAWLSRKGRESYTSHDIQNEIWQIMAHNIIHKVINNVKKASFFSIITDESTDITAKQQLSICLR
jgi:hypothetical protein